MWRLTRSSEALIRRDERAQLAMDLLDGDQVERIGLAFGDLPADARERRQAAVEAEPDQGGSDHDQDELPGGLVDPQIGDHVVIGVQGLADDDQSEAVLAFADKLLAEGHGTDRLAAERGFEIARLSRCPSAVAGPGDVRIAGDEPAIRIDDAVDHAVLGDPTRTFPMQKAG